jgi:hypothetical protein
MYAAEPNRDPGVDDRDSRENALNHELNRE